MSAPTPDDVAGAARGLRAIAAELADPDSELTASAATRSRLEGAALALEVAWTARGSSPGDQMS